MRKMTYLGIGAALGACAMVLVATMTTAQDMAKVSAKCTKVLLDNAQVRVLEVTLKPGEQTGMHSHPSHVVYVVNGGKTKSSLPDGAIKEGDFETGQAVWGDPVTHDNLNAGTTGIKVIVVELKPQK